MEILAPAGNLQKLKYAIEYGADAVYAAGKEFGLRAKAGNLSREELKLAVDYCRKRNRKLYVTVNIFAHNDDIDSLEEYLTFLNNINVDALIISDPGVFSLAREYAPDTTIHISTQANITSWKTAEFWYKAGAKRVILARELTINEIKEIKSKLPDLELEIFVHGAMCISYSGRCLLSAFLNNRSANSGMCTQTCRWKFSLIEESRPNETFDISEDQYGTYILNSKDLCLINRLKEIEEAGLASIKIEGRMKSLYYVSNVTRCYKTALENPNYADFEHLNQELDKISHRVYAEGFFENFDSNNTQYYPTSAYIRNYQFIGEIIKFENNFAFIAIRAKFEIGDEIELIFPQLENDITIKIEKIFSNDDEAIPFTKPNTIVKIPIEQPIPAFGIVRKKVNN